MDNLIVYSEARFKGLSAKVYSKKDGSFFADNLVVYYDNNIELWRISDLFPKAPKITAVEVRKIDDRTLGVYNPAGILYEIDVYERVVKKETYSRF